MQTQSRHVILREDEFEPLLREQASELGGLVAALRVRTALIRSQAGLAHLNELADRLETFLDDHGARQNRTYATLREIVAAIRWLAHIKAVGLHVLGRLDSYRLGIDPGELRRDLEAGHEILDQALFKVLSAFEDEARSVGCKWAPSNLPVGVEVAHQAMLPRNLDLEETSDESQHIAEVAARFLKVLEGSRALNLGFTRPRDELRLFVANHATEERCRYYESSVHNLQSMYDTHIQNTPVEAEQESLVILRGHISVSLHLLEMATDLVHFYERHENDIRHEATREEISDVVSKNDVLHVAVNVCLRHAYLFVESAADLATEILEAFVPQSRVVLVLPEGASIHARPLALIVQVARHYGTPIEIAFDGDHCSANSLMSLILLGGKHPQPATIEASGDARALQDLELLFAAGLGELGDLPVELDYLRVGR